MNEKLREIVISNVKCRYFLKKMSFFCHFFWSVHERVSCPLIIWLCFLFQTNGLGATGSIELDEFFDALSLTTPSAVCND